MNPNNKNQLFRLSAVLYADSNYVVSAKTTLKKIVETALFTMEQASVSIHELIDFILDNYNLHIEEEEINDILDKPKQDSFLVNYKDDVKIISLNENRKVQIESKLKDHTIEYFIYEYLRVHESTIVNGDAQNLIYRFLYDILSSNVESFKKLIDKANSIEALINVDSHSYSLEEREFINGFLKWEFEGKNKAIFDIASFAIEYCLISNDSKQNIEINNLKNKVFYLDTNVIFRALGINGEDRKNRTNTSLKRFQENNTSLFISKYTDLEFKGTIDYYIQRLGNRPFKNEISKNLFRNPLFAKFKDIYNYYYEWRVGKQNHSLDLFKAEVLSQYKSFCNSMNISVDYKNVLKEDDNKIDETLKDYISSINTHKSTDSSSGNYNGFEYDAKNILLLENLRDNKNHSIFDTKQFFLSTDQSLRRWDFQRSNKAPLVIMPSQWMSLLLRYQSRTTDDFKSFVSFLSLPIPEKQISSENIHSVLAGISEVTSSFKRQTYIAQQLIEQGFEKIMQENKNADELFNITVEKSESILEQRIKELEVKQAEDEQKNEERISKLEEFNDSKESIIGQKDSEIEQLKKQNYELHEREKVRSFKNTAFFIYIPSAIILLLLLVLCFFFKSSHWNFMTTFMNFIDGESSVTRQRILLTIISILMTSGVVGFITAAVNRLTKHKIDDYKDKVRARYEKNN